jgi:hypothetical protein
LRGEAWRGGRALGRFTTKDTKHTKGGEGLAADRSGWARKRQRIETSARGMKPTSGRF